MDLSKADVSPRRALWEMVNDLDDWVNCGYRRDVRFELPPARQGGGAGGVAGVADAGGAQLDAESLAQSAAQLRAVEQEVAGCTLCGLHKERKNTVPGTGAVGAVQVMVVGEAPAGTRIIRVYPSWEQRGSTLINGLQRLA